MRYLEKRHTLSVFAVHLAAVLQSSSTVEDHPWNWITNPLGFEDTEVVFEIIDGLVTTLSALKSVVEDLSALCRLPCEFDLRKIDRATGFLHVLPQFPEGLDGDLVGCCCTGSSRESLRQLVTDLSELATARAQIAKVVGDFREPPPIHELKSMQELNESLCALGLADNTLVRLKEILAGSTSLEQALAEINITFERFQALLECEVPRDSHGVELLLGFVRLISAAPFDCLHLRIESREADGACAIARNAVVEGRAPLKLQNDLNLDVNVALALERLSPADLESYASRIEDAGLFARIFGGDYRKAKAFYKRIARNRRRPQRAEMSEAFRHLGECARGINAFVSRSTYVQVLGIHFNGISSDWDALSSIADWYEQVFTYLPEHYKEALPLRQLLLRGRAERLKALRNVHLSERIHVERLDRVKSLLPTILESIGDKLADGTATADLLDAVRTKNVKIASLISELEATGIDPGSPLRVLSKIISSGYAYLNAKDRVANNQSAIGMLGERYCGARTDSAPIEDALSFAESVVGAGLPSSVVGWILVREYDTRITLFRHKLDDLARYRVHLAELCESLDTRAGSALSKTICDSPLSEAERLLARSLESKEKIEEWAQFLRAKEDASNAGLGKVAGLAENRTLAPDHLVPAFDYLFYNSLSQNIFDKHPVLSSFSLCEKLT